MTTAVSPAPIVAQVPPTNPQAVYASAPAGCFAALPASAGQIPMARPPTIHFPQPLAAGGLVPFGVTMRGAGPIVVSQVIGTPSVTPIMPTRSMHVSAPASSVARDAHDKLLAAAAAKIKQLAVVASKVEPAVAKGCPPLTVAPSPSPGDAAGGGNRLSFSLDTTLPPSSGRAIAFEEGTATPPWGATDADTRASLQTRLSIESLQDTGLDHTEWISEYNLLHAELEESEQQAQEERSLREHEFESLQGQLQSLQTRLGASLPHSLAGTADERSPIADLRPVPSDLEANRNAERDKYIEKGRRALQEADQELHAETVGPQTEGAPVAKLPSVQGDHAEPGTEPGLDILRKNLRDAMDWMDRLKNQQDFGTDTAAAEAVVKRAADAGAGLPSTGSAVVCPSADAGGAGSGASISDSSVPTVSAPTP